MVSKGFPNVITSGRQYNIGEKPSVILYTYINLIKAGKSPQLYCTVTLIAMRGHQKNSEIKHGSNNILSHRL